MVVQVIPIPHSVFYFHSHGIPVPIGNPIPMHISIMHLTVPKFLTLPSTCKPDTMQDKKTMLLYEYQNFCHRSIKTPT